MKLDGREVKAVSIPRAITSAATFALTEATLQGKITEELADTLIERMNAIVQWLYTGKIVAMNDETKTFEARDLTEAEGVDELPEDLDTPNDVLVITPNGE